LLGSAFYMAQTIPCILNHIQTQTENKHTIVDMHGQS
jgi:hypothetical protein